MTDQHLLIKPVKVPENVSLGANVEPGQLTNARDQVMNVTSNINASGSFLTHFVTFKVNSHKVEGAQATKLQNVIDTFKGAETSPGRGRRPLDPDPRRAHRPRELHRRGGLQPEAFRAARRTRSRTSCASTGSSTSRRASRQAAWVSPTRPAARSRTTAAWTS